MPGEVKALVQGHSLSLVARESECWRCGWKGQVCVNGAECVVFFEVKAPR